jgi:hypothetical protein
MTPLSRLLAWPLLVGLTLVSPAQVAAGPGCGWELRAHAHWLSAHVVSIEISAEGIGKHPVELRFSGRCPSAVTFRGLPANYDHFDWCASNSICVPGGPVNVTLVPGLSRSLGSFEIDARGGTCNRALAAGSYTITPRLKGASPAVCKTVAATITVGNPPVRSHGAMPPADPHFCRRSSDCVTYCPKELCCPRNNCDCREAVRRDYVATYEARHAQACQGPPCPRTSIVSCCENPPLAAICRKGRCEVSPE